MEQKPPLNVTADRPASYDAFPRVVSAPEGRVFLAWCSLRDRRDEICVRSFDSLKSPGTLSPVEVVSLGGAVNSWPTPLPRHDGTLEVVWGTHRAGRSEVRTRQGSPDGVWAPEATCVAADAWQPTATLDRTGALWVAWADVRHSAICVRCDDGPVEVVSGPDSQRPALFANQAGVTVAWDAYAAGTYDVYARRWSAEEHTWGPIEPVSRGPEQESLPNLGPGPDGSVMCCWVSDADVRDDRGIIDQWPSIRCGLSDGDA